MGIVKVTWRLVGFDKQTESVADEYKIPKRFRDYTWGVAQIIYHINGDTTVDVYGDTELTAEQANLIAGACGFHIDVLSNDYFLCPSGDSLVRST